MGRGARRFDRNLRPPIPPPAATFDAEMTALEPLRKELTEHYLRTVPGITSVAVAVGEDGHPCLVLGFVDEAALDACPPLDPRVNTYVMVTGIPRPL